VPLVLPSHHGTPSTTITYKDNQPISHSSGEQYTNFEPKSKSDPTLALL
jgi:hypothetical protein